MKFKKLIALMALSTVVLTGCATEEATPEKDATEATDQEATKEKAEDQASTEDKEDTKEEVEETLNVVSATVAATQVMDQLEVDLVGVPTTKFTLPERYKDVTPVGQSMSPDFEIVASLDPDLVIIDKNFQEDVEESLKSYGIDAYYFNTGTYSGFLQSIEEVGEAIGVEAEAQALITELKEAETLVNEMKGDTETLEVAILFGGGENFMLATDASYLGDLVQTVGVDNITDDLEIDSAYIPFSMEQIVAQNPDYILRFAHGNIEETKKAFDESFDKNPAFDTLGAVKNGNVVDLDPSIFGVSANIYVTDAITELGNLFYGE